MSVIIQASMQQDTSTVVLAIALVFGSYLLYVFTLSPTAHIPGPWWARLSKLPLLYATFKGYRASYVDELLQRYQTNVVVVAPNQVHLSDDTAIKTVYDRHAVKTNFYANMGSWKGVKSTLGILDYAGASTTRNNLIKCFQNRNLEVLSDHIDGHVRHFVDALGKHADAKKPTECLFWFRLLALDIVTDVLWGEQTNLVLDADKGNVNSLFLRRFHAFSKYNALRSFIPGLDTFVVLFGSKQWRGYRSDLSDLDLTAREALQRWESAKNKGGGGDGENDEGHEKDVLSMLANLNNHSDAKKRIKTTDIPAYLVEMLAAGSSTTSTTAALCCHELARDEETQRKLFDELLDAFPDPHGVTLAQAQSLPLLRAVLRETMRMYPVIPGPLERKLGSACDVPATSSQQHTIRLHAGTIASASAYTQSRLADVYAQPTSWLPSRWLTDDSKERMDLNWIPFGTGSRACPGSNLALNELHLMLAAVFRSFSATLDEHGDGDGGHVRMVDHFTAAPQKGTVWVRFHRRSDAVTGVA